MHGPGYASYDGERVSKRRGTLPRLFRLHEAEATMTIVGTLLPFTCDIWYGKSYQKLTLNVRPTDTQNDRTGPSPACPVPDQK